MKKIINNNSTYFEVYLESITRITGLRRDKFNNDSLIHQLTFDAKEIVELLIEIELQFGLYLESSFVDDVVRSSKITFIQLFDKIISLITPQQQPNLKIQ